MTAPDDHDPTGRDVELGLMSVNNHINEQADQLHRLCAHVYALTELLVRDDVIDAPELESRRGVIFDQMRAKQPLRWLTARVHHLETDKYDPVHAVVIDCASRLPLCRAACCRLSFYLGNQDLEEGIVRWDLARPYHIKQTRDGYCVHCRSTDRSCDVWDHRPQACRSYDCRNDSRIWLDFEARIPNPAIAEHSSGVARVPASPVAPAEGETP